MTVAARTSRITLTMTDDEALQLQALLIGSINWARNPWAKDVYDALEEIDLEPSDEQCAQVRKEIERYVETTADGPDVLVGDIPVLDEEEDDYP